MQLRAPAPSPSSLALLLAALVACAAPPAGAQEVDATTLRQKLIMGYQGWFTCPGDGSPTDRWTHWFRDGVASASTATVDCWPDVSELDPDELFDTGFTRPDGSSAPVFSSYRRKTVLRHFRWMKDYGLDGVALQRFTHALRASKQRALRDAVALNVKAGAEAHGRVFYLMYDISGHDPATLVEDVKRDWVHAVDRLGLTSSPRYLHHRGRPLLAIWGLGFLDRPGTAAQARALIDYFQRQAPERYRVTLMGGVPLDWRTLRPQTSTKTDPAWAGVYRSFDVISPWTVNAFRDDAGADRYLSETLRADLAEATRAGADYMPVVFPGFSWRNLYPQSRLNETPRRGGRFYWRQVFNALDAGCTSIYGAMFDEVDEGTAMFKLAPTAADVPAQGQFLPLDADGERLPSDWYLRLAGEASKALRGEIAYTARRPIHPEYVVEDAEVRRAKLPTRLAPGEVFKARIRVKNTGTTTWDARTVALGAVGDSDPLHRRVRVRLPDGARIAPGQAHTFRFTLEAPREPGTVTTDWQMVHERVGWFGQIARQDVRVRRAR